MREQRREGGDLAGDVVDQPARRGQVVGPGVDRAVLGLQRPDAGDRVLERQPVLVELDGVGSGGHRGGRERVRPGGGTGGPGHDVGPQGAVVELLDGVVAEQVGVGEGDHPAESGLHRGGQRLAGRVGGGAGGREDLRTGGAVQGQHAGAVEADLGHTGQHALADGGTDVGEHPGRDVLVPASPLLHGGADDRDAEAAEQLLQVVAVLVLVALPQHDQPAAAADERLDQVELLRAEPRRPGAGHALGAPLGRVRDHQHVTGTQHVAGERSAGVGVHVVATTDELLRRQGVAGVGGVDRVDRPRRLGAEAPGLAVGLVEHQAREVFHQGLHQTGVFAVRS